MQINGDALKAIRERSGYSQSDLGRQTGISQNRISTIESKPTIGVRPATALALANALGVPVAAIVVPQEASVA